MRAAREDILLAAGATPHGNKAVRVLSEGMIELGGHQGLQLEIERPGGRTAKARIYFTGDRLYTLLATDEQSRVRRFVESFSLLKADDAAEQQDAPDEVRKEGTQ